MRSFDEIFAIAADRHGGAEALSARLEPPTPPEQLAALVAEEVAKAKK